MSSVDIMMVQALSLFLARTVLGALQVYMPSVHCITAHAGNPRLAASKPLTRQGAVHRRRC